jgi:hypothetical protein
MPTFACLAIATTKKIKSAAQGWYVLDGITERNFYELT